MTIVKLLKKDNIERMEIMLAIATSYNPLLLDALNNTTIDSEEVEKTPSNQLPGKYVQQVLEKKEDVPSLFSENIYTLKCKNCGKKFKYDLGLIVVNEKKYMKEENPPIFETIQATGYFRCKNCNAAGNWEETSDLLIGITTSMAALLARMGDESNIQLGEFRMFDGSFHRWSTDSEAYLLSKIMEDKQNSFLWNRLGNIYYKGGRPELATAAFERSLQLNPFQTESHFSIGEILDSVGESDAAFYHLRETLITAQHYNHLEPMRLRDMLTDNLLLLFQKHSDIESFFSFLPTGQEIVGEPDEKQQEKMFGTGIDLELFPDEPVSFFPLAEMYMGRMAKKIPSRDRTLDRLLGKSTKTANKPKKTSKKKKEKNKRKMKKKSKK